MLRPAFASWAGAAQGRVVGVGFSVVVVGAVVVVVGLVVVVVLAGAVVVVVVLTGGRDRVVVLPTVVEVEPSGSVVVEPSSAVVDVVELVDVVEVLLEVVVVLRSTCRPSTSTGSRWGSSRTASTATTAMHAATTSQNHRPSRTRCTP